MISHLTTISDQTPYGYLFNYSNGAVFFVPKEQFEDFCKVLGLVVR